MKEASKGLPFSETHSLVVLLPMKDPSSVSQTDP